jgi:hypothetical protein
MFNFKQYLTALQQLDVNRTLLTTSRSVILLSGSSHYQHASLTIEQQQFLAYFQSFGYQIVPSNFPYNQDFDYQQTEFPSLFRASISNIHYYGHTLSNRAFHKELIRHLQPLFDLDEIILVTQSSGLNMLTQVLTHMTVKPTLKIVALGPVSLQKLSLRENGWIVKGKTDYYSRFLDFNQQTNVVACGHHEYLLSPAVKEVLDDIIQN